jgi:hypothetical protein
VVSIQVVSKGSHAAWSRQLWSLLIYITHSDIHNQLAELARVTPSVVAPIPGKFTLGSPHCFVPVFEHPYAVAGLLFGFMRLNRHASSVAFKTIDPVALAP